MNRLLSAGLLKAVILFTTLAATVVVVHAQQTPARPDRGTMPGATYSVSNIESVSLTNGNVHLSIPLASLPPIAGGKLSLGISAVYNSKLWNITRHEHQLPPISNCASWTVDTPQLNEPQGGWQLTAGYRIDFREATEDVEYLVPDTWPGGCETDYQEYLRLQQHWYKVMLTTPDGAEHELRPLDTNAYYGYNGGSRLYLYNYYSVLPSAGNPMRYYSLDGTFIYATITTGSDWTLYLNDGTRVTSVPGTQRIIDTNGNSIKIQGYDLTDEQTGRQITYSYDASANGGKGQGQVHYKTVTGVDETILVNFDTTNVQGKLYRENDWSYIGGETGGYVCFHDAPLNVTVPVIRTIVFPATEIGPDPQRFSFSYNSDTTESATDTIQWACQTTPETYTRTASHGMGALSRVVTPSGATIDYTYSQDGGHRFSFDNDAITRETVTHKTVTHDGISETWTYEIDELGGNYGKVTSPEGAVTTESHYQTNPAFGIFYSGGGYGGLTFRVNHSNKQLIERHWTRLPFSGANQATAGTNNGLVPFNPVVDAEYTTLLDDTPSHNRVKMSARTYQYDFNGNLVSQTDYDWFDPSLVTFDPNTSVPTGVPASATVLRTTTNDYYNSAPTSTSTNVYAKRSLSNPTPLILGALQQTTAGSAVAQFSYDTNSYGTPPTSGNLTTKNVYDDVDNTWIAASMAYDSYGNVSTTTDGRGKLTSFTYDSCTHANVVSVTVNPDNGTGSQTSYTAYDCYTGLPTSSTDVNGKTSTVDYTNQLLGAVDPFGRPGITKAPALTVNGSSQQRRVTTFYEDASHRVTVATDLYAENDQLLKTRTTADELGRPVLSEQTEDGTNYTTFSKKAYDTANRISYASSPMRCTVAMGHNDCSADPLSQVVSASTNSWTRVTNDVLGRPLSVATFGGASQPPSTGTTGVTGFTGEVVTAYDYNFTTVTDQAGKSRRSKVDGLGRLVRVDEPDGSGDLGTTSSPNQATSYDYDVFGNLLHVYQGSQTRTFTYDSLSRLRTAANPESGTVTYTYDPNGNLLTKLDARSITTSYVYDSLNRVTSRSYSDSTPTVSYVYDSASISNGKGRLASISSSVSSYAYSGYDAVGKVTGATQTIGSQSYSLSYSYDLAGHVTGTTYPSGRSVSYNYDNAGRLADKDSTHLAFTGTLGDGTTRTYTKGIVYSAMGQMTQEQFGTTTAVYNKLAYNSRGQLTDILASTSGGDTTFNRGKIVNDYGTTGNNGNLLKQTVYVPDSDANTSPTSWYQQYDYDSLNRLGRVREFNSSDTQLWKQTFAYDRYGNRTIDLSNTTDGIPKPNFSVSTSTNRLGVPIGESGTMTYDNAGNLTTDTHSAAAVTRLYDAENRMTKETQAGSYDAGVYSYDGDGRRVKRVVGAVETWQVYGIGGELLAEYAATASASNPQKEYGYRNGQLLVTLTSAAGGGSPSYTYNPLEAEASVIHAADITELRTAVNQARGHAGLSAATWTDTSLSGVQIKAVHITELRTKLNEARSALGLSTVSWTDSSLSGVTVKAVHLNELRTKVAETIGNIDIRWMVTDQLGTPRIIVDQTGNLPNMSRHDYLPFGEELFAGTGGRTTAQGYSASDGVRQQFTQKERDNETGLDYFGARYFASAQGRFISPDPLLASGTVESPESWNRYSYAFNNPLKWVDPTGMWNWAASAGGSYTDDELEARRHDRSLSRSDRKAAKNALKFRERFRGVMGQGEDAVRNSNLTAEQKTQVLAAMNSYGSENDRNGVVVGVREPQRGSSTGAGTLLNDDGTISVTFRTDHKGKDLIIDMAHEGQHVADADAFLASGARANDPTDLTHRDREIRGYTISSMVAQALGVSSAVKGFEGRDQIWNSGWKKADQATIDSRRAQRVERFVGIPRVGYPANAPGDRYSQEFHPRP